MNPQQQNRQRLCLEGTLQPASSPNFKRLDNEFAAAISLE
jgi:hypothetical protein